MISPAQEKAVSDVWSLPLQLTARGSAVELGRFLDQLQGADQRRAVLIEAVNLTSERGTGSDSTRELSITARAFVTPGTGAPAVVTD